jgi:hypothetical protein
MLTIRQYYIKHELNESRSISIDPNLDRSKQLILMIAAWWLAIPISIGGKIDRHCFVVTDDFWDIVELHINDSIAFANAGRSIEQHESGIKWYETLLKFRA